MVDQDDAALVKELRECVQAEGLALMCLVEKISWKKVFQPVQSKGEEGRFPEHMIKDPDKDHENQHMW